MVHAPLRWEPMGEFLDGNLYLMMIERDDCELGQQLIQIFERDDRELGHVCMAAFMYGCMYVCRHV